MQLAFRRRLYLEPFLSEPGRFGDRRAIRVGLLGGSFNPAHAGHLHIAHAFARHLRLRQVWLLVSPGNPLKTATCMAPFAARLRSARGIADGRRIVATGIEGLLGTRYSVDTVAELRRRFPRMRFVWLMGADNLAQLPHWRRWMAIARAVPMAVHARPGSGRAALAGQAARRLERARLSIRQAGLLADAAPPAWLFLPVATHPASATALRRAGHGINSPDSDPKSQS